MFRKVIIGIMTLGTLAFAGCAEDKDSKGSGEALKLGAAFAFTGPLAPEGLECEQASDLAVSQINAAGGILGQNLSLVKRDTQTNPALCGDIATDLIQNQNVPVIFGALSSGCTSNILDVAVPAKVLTGSAVSLSTSLTYARENNGLFFRTIGASYDAMRALAEEIVDAGYTTVTVIASDNRFTASSSDDFIAAFGALTCGSTPCTVNLRHDYSETIDPNTYDFAADMTTIMAAGSDAIFFNGYPEDGLGFLQAALAAGYTGTPYISVPMANNIGGFLDAATAAKVRWIYAPPYSGQSYNAFKASYESTYKIELASSRISEQAYDLVMIVALAMVKAGTVTDGAAIAAAIRDVSNPPGQLVYSNQYAQIVQLIESGADVDYVGASGSCDINERGDAEIVQQMMGYVNGVPTPVN
ncbi:MAG: ABC transporter substrate-binding protein [Deltaproteobacteria bacterium]|nr:ABC transporter substrate-binding protein [Deltaproteobacteria bacterium]